MILQKTKGKVLHEREAVFETLEKTLELAKISGQIILLSGGAGMGKTSATKEFIDSLPTSLPSYMGYCDPLFTPRPLGPILDILHASKETVNDWSANERNSIFLELINLMKEPCVVVIEDVHWADYGTLDFIKFLNRRIHLTKCMVVLTFRPDEIQEASILGLSHTINEAITRIKLKPLSKSIVLSLCQQYGVDGQHIYSLTNGNPFFTTEYLMNHSGGIPDSINNLIVSRISILNVKEQEALFKAALFPNPVPLKVVTALFKNWDKILRKSFELGFVSIERDSLRFRHEIVRLVIESSIPEFKKIVIHSDILEVLEEDTDTDIIEIIHHAKGAKKYRKVAELAPKAARRARDLGVHKEAALLFKAAIDCTEKMDDGEWLNLLEEYSFECYLTNSLDEALDFRYRALKHIEGTDKVDKERAGINYCWLSRLFWYQANSKMAFKYGELAIEHLKNSVNKNISAQTFSNFGQLHMLKGNYKNARHWSEKAYDLAKSVGNLDIQAHSLTNLGSLLIRKESTAKEGFSHLKLAEELAIEAKNHDHAARIHTTLLCDKIIKREDPSQIMEKTLDFASKYQVESYYHYDLAWRSYYLFQKGNWQESLSLSEQLLGVNNQAKINAFVAAISKCRILMRQGHTEIKKLLTQMAEVAQDTVEAQRTVPIATAMLEFEWLYEHTFEDRSIIHSAIEQLAEDYGSRIDSGELAFWSSRVGMSHPIEVPADNGFSYLIDRDTKKAIDSWSANYFPYELALSYCLGNNDQIREGFKILEDLQATQTKKRVREYLKESGRTTVPKGILKSTRTNPLHLTNRELGVLKEVSNGLTNVEIASKLFISSKTVDNHVSSILSKLDVSSRQKAIVRAMELKIF